MDIDGVLADCSHRLHYLKEKDYEKFYSEEEMLKDKVKRTGVDFLYEMIKDNKIILLTGRPYRTEDATRIWLGRILPEFSRLEMVMRKNHDFRPSDVVKAELMKELTDGSEGETILFVDDDPKNVKAVEQACPNVQGIIFGSSRLEL